MNLSLKSIALVFITTFVSRLQAADLPKPLASGLKTPESVCLGPHAELYVTEIGEFGKDGDGQIAVIRDGKPHLFAKGLDDPKGIVFFDKAFYVTDKTRVVKVDAQGQVSTFAAPEKFSVTPKFLNDIAIEPESGTLFVSDSGDLQGRHGAVFSIAVKTGQTELIIDSKILPALKTPNGLILENKSNLLLVDFASGILYRIKLADNSSEQLAEGFDGGDGLSWDKSGRLFVSSWKTGKVFVINKLGDKPTLVTDKFQQAADSCLSADGKSLLVPDMMAGTLTALPLPAR